MLLCGLLVAALGALSAACGGDTENTPDGPAPASLEGERVDRDNPAPRESALTREAPTDAHTALAALIPTSGMVRDSVAYVGWDGDNARPLEDHDSPIKAISVEYRSRGWTMYDEGAGKDGRVEFDYPQQCRLVVIRAPETGRAAEVIEENIIENLQSRGFTRINSLGYTVGMGADKQVRVPRYARIDSQEELDIVYIAYVKVVNDIVIFALESEQPRSIEGEGDEKLAVVTEAGLGTRIGAQYLSLVYDRINP